MRFFLSMRSQAAFGLLGILLLAACKKEASSTPHASRDSLPAAPDSSPSAPPSRNWSLEDTAHLRLRTDSLRQEWSKRMDSLNPPIPGFARLPWDFQLHSVDSGRSPLLRRFLGENPCGNGDSLFDVYHSNGDMTFGASGEERFTLADSFAMTHGLRSGMSRDEVRGILGTPYREGGDAMSYGVEDWGEKEHNGKVVYRESIRLFFQQGKLRFVWTILPFYGC